MDGLNESHFSFKCPMNLEDMQATAHGRFCGSCKKEVFDLTHCSLDEVRALEQKHGPLCGSIRMAQVATVAISLAAAACQEKPDHRPHVVGLIAAPPASHGQTDQAIPRPTTGSIRLPPVQPEGAADATHEAVAPTILGKIQVPPKREDENNEVVAPKPTPPSE